MPTPCKKRNSTPGIIVISRSGKGSSTICNLNGQADVRHIVEIRNLMLYKADVECVGRISGNPRAIEFLSPNARPVGQDDEKTWRDAVPDLDDKNWYTFDHVQLIAVSSGRQKVNTTVKVVRKARGDRETVSVSIDVEHR